MTEELPRLATLFDGWDGHQRSLVNAVAPLTAEQLGWRPAAHLNTIGELARHISLGRLLWSERMGAPGVAAVTSRIDDWAVDGDGNRYIVEASLPIAEQAAELVLWLEQSWGVIERVLDEWALSELAVTYRHRWNGTTYRVSRQWTLWRLLTHDIHHGGQISLGLGMQGIEAFELGALFGHITPLPVD